MTVHEIKNSNEFDMKVGKAKISYTLQRSVATLTKYEFISEDDAQLRSKSLFEDDPASPVNGCPYFNRQIKVALIRCQRWGQDSCINMVTANMYLKMIDAFLRLQSGGRVSLNWKDTYITSTCCAVSDETYQSASHGDMMNSALASCREADGAIIDAKYSSRLFVSDGNFGWAGLGVVGNVWSIRDGYNYWAIMRYPSDPVNQEQYDYKGGVLIHEFGHNMGYNHASFVDSNPTYFLPSFNWPNNYGDGANIMGTAGSWYTIPGPYHYYRCMSEKKVEQHWLGVPERGTTKYRMFMWDHPYSRHFLGTEAPRLNDDEIIDGIPYKNNIMIIEIPYTREDMCSTVNADYKYSSFTLEYRQQGDQKGFGKKGLRALNYRFEDGGLPGVSILLDTQTDNIDNWSDSSIPFGIYYIPPEIDNGFLAIHITKFHLNTLTFAMEQTNDTSVHALSEVPYVEFDITLNPGIPYVSVPIPTGAPEYKWSSNLYDCKVKFDLSGYDCKIMGTKLFWAYIVPQGSRGHPRVYYINNGYAFASSSSSILSLNGNDLMNWYHGLGDITKFKVRVDISYSNSPDYRVNYWLSGTLYKRGISESDDKYIEVGKGNILLLDNMPYEGESTSIYIMDLYGNRIDIPQDSRLVTMLPDLLLTGASECYVTVEKDNKYISSKPIILRNMKSTTRLAIYYMTDSIVQIGPASIPESYYTVPTSFIRYKEVQANEWIVTPVSRMAFGDWFYIDIHECIPKDTTMYLDTDIGIISVYLGRFEGLCNISFRYTYTYLHNLGSPNGILNAISFSNAMALENVRPVYVSRQGNNLPNQNELTDHYNMGDIRYRIVAEKVPNTFSFSSFEKDFNGVTYSFDSIDKTYDVKLGEVYPFNWMIIVYICIGILCILVLGLIIWLFKCICNRSSKSRNNNNYSVPPSANTNGQLTRASYTPNSTISSSIPPPPPPTSRKPSQYMAPPPPPPTYSKPNSSFMTRKAPPPPPPSMAPMAGKRAPPPPPPAFRR
ncbi:hypothetical protein WA158_001464 [Blastocystis sp. Blastoise]